MHVAPACGYHNTVHHLLQRAQGSAVATKRCEGRQSCAGGPGLSWWSVLQQTNVIDYVRLSWFTARDYFISEQKLI